MADDILHNTNPSDGRVQKSSSLQHSNSISGAAGAPNPRSCVTCRKRKVKCDKKHPCSNCARAKIECIFPGPGRAPRKSRKPPDGELMDRLRRLEGVVQSLNAQVEEHEAADEERNRQSSAGTEEKSEGCPFGTDKRPSVAVDNTVEGLESRFGRLVVDQGRSRYINNSFWASLSNEVEDLKSILIEHSDDEEDIQDSPDSSNYSSQHQGFLFGYSSTSVNMLELHPTPERAKEYWEVYKENVDPLVKVLHIPSIEPTFLDAITHLEKMPKGLECLLFAIYYGAVTSNMPNECQEKWGEKRSALLERYRFGLEQALARANFLYCDETIILQAFIVFLMLLRRNDDARKIWTLTGLVVRIAQTLGIHRDGSHFGLPPFEIEMRRRLWWQVCILDARASEDHGCDPTIVEAQFDTKMPLNVNDTDLDPKMTGFPEERVGFTDMTFCLIRFEVANIFRRILYIPPGPTRCNEFFAGLTISEKEKWISECHQRLEDKYLKYTDMSVPLYWVTATISRLVMSKMWLIVYHPHQRRDGGASLPQDTRDKLFITSLENLEYSILLETEARTMKWGWLFRTYVQWHAIAFLLSELCVRTKGEAVDRAWSALEATAGRWWFPLSPQYSSNKRSAGCLWKPLRRLMAKARAARERELALERASQALKNGPVMYQDLPQLLGQMQENSSDQPNSDNVDKMLRPAAPRLGEMPIAQAPTWGSPIAENASTPLFDGTEDLSSIMKRTGPADSKKDISSSNTISKSNGASPKTNGDPSSPLPEAAKHFQTLTSYGLEDLMTDIWADNGWRDGTVGEEVARAPHVDITAAKAANGFGVQRPTPTATTTAQGLPSASNATTDQQLRTATHAFNNFPSFDAFGANGNSPASFGSSANMGGGGSSGNSSNSPNMDTTMDWANWDDMVREFGMNTDINDDGGVVGQGGMGGVGMGMANGPGHYSGMNWF